MQTETLVQRIYSCSNNHPRTGLRIDFKAITQWNDNIPLYTEFYSVHNRQRVYPDNHSCMSCGQLMRSGDVFAVYNEEGHCDLRCERAIGSICVCSCGGPNHGRYWLMHESVSLVA